MKVEKRAVNAEKLYYIACDGFEFETKRECYTHEKALRRSEYKEQYTAIPKIDNVSTDVDPEMMDRWFYVQSDTDLDAIKIELYADDSAAMEFESNEFPCWVRVLVDEDGYGVIESLEECIGSCSHYLEFLNTLRTGQVVSAH